MKIVVLDGHCLNPGDLSWQAFEAIGDLEVYASSPPETVVQRSEGATALITNKTVLTAEIMDQLPELKYIGILATGVNVVDCEAARKRNIAVSNAPNYSTDSVVQCAFAHILNLSFQLAAHDQAVVEGKWTNCPHFCFWDTSLMELKDKKLGIVGFGAIGRGVAKIGHAFEMQVLAYGPHLKVGALISENVEANGSALQRVKCLDLDQLIQESDVISLHCPLTVANKKMVNAAFLAKMKPTAFLINTARGGLVDEQALADALNSERISGAGLDVLASEPPHSGNPLIGAKNCVISPHIAWATVEARSRLMELAAENLKMFLQGTPQNLV